MSKKDKYIGEMKAIFKNAKDKHEANYQSKQVMADMSGDKEFFSEILLNHIEKKDSLNTKHYPVVGIDIELNEDFGIVANCWIPLPDRNTEMSTKAIHHHGDMLLTTATAFGTGYEHWTFELPELIDEKNELYKLKVIEQSPHPLHHVGFVDAYTAHLPLYPPDLTITYALWSNRFKTTWKDKIKRNEMLQKNKAALKKLAVKFGLAKNLDLKMVEYFDFYPTCNGFRGIKDREEFARSNNEDYLASLFNIVQETDNEHLLPVFQAKLNSNEVFENKSLIKKYVDDLESGEKIEGRLSSNHYGVEKANFTKAEILQALETQNRK